jgi:hypothetical protein
MLNFSFSKFLKIKKVEKIFFFLFFAGIFSISAQINVKNIDDQRELFPKLYFLDAVTADRAKSAGQPYWVKTQEESDAGKSITPDQRSLLLNNDILAYYGHPNSTQMGILGRYSMEELRTRLTTLAGEYKTAGGKNVITAFYIIYGTVWPQGEIGIIKDELLVKYIDFAQKNNMLVFIDHQIGKYDPVTAIKRMLPYLKYPNVHLALDPEWRTIKPMKEIGEVTAAELNQVQKVMEDYMRANNIAGERMLVIHQFKPWMIKNRADLRTSFSKVRLVHCADGFGTPAQKRGSYRANAFDDYEVAAPVKPTLNIPVKSFKLFYNFNIPGAGFDKPLFSPKEVLSLNPRPYLIIYQ